MNENLHKVIHDSKYEAFKNYGQFKMPQKIKLNWDKIFKAKGGFKKSISIRGRSLKQS